MKLAQFLIIACIMQVSILGYAANSTESVIIEFPTGTKVIVNSNGKVVTSTAQKQKKGVCYTIKAGTGLLHYSKGSSKVAAKWARDLGIDYNSGLPKDRKLYVDENNIAKLVLKCPSNSIQK